MPAIKNKIFDYDIALSFAGEDRYYVKEVADTLKEAGVTVFYDEFEESNLWGKNLYTYLRQIYRDRARYTVIFISRYYNNKLWTNHERESAQERAFTESSEYILPVRLDDTEIPGLQRTVAYIDLRSKTPYEFCKIVCAKLGVELQSYKYINKKLHDAVMQTLDEENALTESQLNGRNNHWDSFQAFMDSLGPKERFQHQKKNSLYYVDKYGVSVSQLKEHLTTLTMYKGAIDDVFTEELADSIERFQKLSNMRHVDGVVGQLTLREIESRLKEKESRT